MLLTVWKRLGASIASGVLAATLFTFATTAAPASDSKGNGNGVAKGAQDDHVPGELIVKFKATATDAEIQQGLKRGHLKIKRHLQTEGMKARGHNGLTKVETDLPVDEAIAQLQNDPSVDYVEPNYTYKHQFVANDPYVTGNYTWGLYSALSSPANVYGSGAEDAWTAGYVGTNSVYVAVIDEGIDVWHPELAANIWNNPKDPIDGIDNDGNGYVDDAHGWNFYAGNNQVFDSTGDQHGTHVSGTIGAKGGNASGVAGVNWNVTILSGKFLGADGGDTLAAIEAIDYFVDLKKRQGINLVAINASWGGSGYTRSLHDSIIRAAKAGILFCAAAGNDSLNNDVSASYPANIDTTKGTSTESAASFNGVISVAAIDSTGALASFSNYGAKTVHIGAPGVQILSTYPNSQVGYMSGTSMATPHVTGAVALYASTHPGASAQSIRDAIIKAATPTPSLTGKTTSGARLNVASIINPGTTVTPPAVLPPAAPTGVSASSAPSLVGGTASVTVRWSAVSGATSYIVKRATSVSGTYLTVATGVTTTSFSQAATSTANNTYYYRIVAVGTSGNSADSTSASVTTVAPAPVNLSAAAVSSYNVSLSWTDRSADEQGFKIEYWNGLSWVQIGTVGAGTTSVNISGTSSRSTYYFRVRAYNGTSNTGYSNSVSVTTP